MQRLLLPYSTPFLLLSLLLLSSFHGRLASAQTIFNFTSGKVDSNSLTSVLHGSFGSAGTLTLDSTAGDAQAFYSKSFSLLDTPSLSVLSFSSIFTFAANASSGNGTVAFVLTTADVQGEAVDLTEARKTLTIEFNTSCSADGYGGPGGYHGGGGWGGGGRFGGFGGGFGGFGGGFQVVEYANSTSIANKGSGGYGPNWTGNYAGPFFCSQQPLQDLSDLTFQYQIAVEYNASTDIVSVGSPSCGDDIARTTQFAVQNLSGIINKPVYVGFVVSGGGIFNLSQWSFTSNTSSSSVANLALSSAFSTPGGGGSGGGGGRGHSSGGLKKGYVIGFSVLGAAIGVAAVALAFCLCARRRRATSARFVAKSVGTIPESAVVFDARKPNAPPAKVVLVDRDTAPLNTHPNSAFHGSAGGATWLQPVAPR